MLSSRAPRSRGSRPARASSVPGSSLCTSISTLSPCASSSRSALPVAATWVEPSRASSSNGKRSASASGSSRSGGALAKRSASGSRLRAPSALSRMPAPVIAPATVSSAATRSCWRPGLVIADRSACDLEIPDDRDGRRAGGLVRRTELPVAFALAIGLQEQIGLLHAQERQLDRALQERPQPHRQLDLRDGQHVRPAAPLGIGDPDLLERDGRGHREDRRPARPRSRRRDRAPPTPRFRSGPSASSSRTERGPPGGWRQAQQQAAGSSGGT